MRLTPRIIQRLPKVDIHCHLDGCLRPRTVLELADAQGVRLPTRKLPALTRVLQAGRRTRSLADYLKIFDITLSVMQERDALYRVAYELAEDAAAENVRHLEVRYSPILHRQKRMALEDVVDAVIAGLADAGRRYNVSTGVIICGIRSMNPRYSVVLAELAVAYKGRGVLAFDLAGQEKDYPAKAHRAAFELILKNNINSTVHAGEAFGPASIAQALHYCGAHRIGHGVRLREDGDLLNYVKEEGKKDASVQRYKGLGEMNAEQLADTTMNPEKRTLLLVKLEDLEESEVMFSTLMGEDVESRRKFIEENALDVKNLDV